MNEHVVQQYKPKGISGLQYRLERICVNECKKHSKARREQTPYKSPWWFRFVSKAEFRLRKYLERRHASKTAAS